MNLKFAKLFKSPAIIECDDNEIYDDDETIKECPEDFGVSNKNDNSKHLNNVRENNLEVKKGKLSKVTQSKKPVFYELPIDVAAEEEIYDDDGGGDEEIYDDDVDGDDDDDDDDDGRGEDNVNIYEDDNIIRSLKDKNDDTTSEKSQINELKAESKTDRKIKINSPKLFFNKTFTAFKKKDTSKEKDRSTRHKVVDEVYAEDKIDNEEENGRVLEIYDEDDGTSNVTTPSSNMMCKDKNKLKEADGDVPPKSHILNVKHKLEGLVKKKRNLTYNLTALMTKKGNKSVKPESKFSAKCNECNDIYDEDEKNDEINDQHNDQINVIPEKCKNKSSQWKTSISYINKQIELLEAKRKLISKRIKLKITSKKSDENNEDGKNGESRIEEIYDDDDGNTGEGSHALSGVQIEVNEIYEDDVGDESVRLRSSLICLSNRIKELENEKIRLTKDFEVNQLIGNEEDEQDSNVQTVSQEGSSNEADITAVVIRPSKVFLSIKDRIKIYEKTSNK